MVLTEKQRNILTEYHNDDLSLAEIAENYGITRQGIRDAIKHGEATLMEMEEKLGTARRTERIGALLPGWKSLSARCACAILGLFEPECPRSAGYRGDVTIFHRLDTQRRNCPMAFESLATALTACSKNCAAKAS